MEEILQTSHGDLNLEGKVDFADFLALAENFGATDAAWALGDLDGNRAVTQRDFAILRGAFGASR